MYPNSNYKCIQGEKENIDFESGRWTRSWMHLENKQNLKIFVSPWDLDFEGNQWNVFPESELSNAEFCNVLCKKFESFWDKNAFTHEFWYDIEQSLKDTYYSSIPLEMNINIIANWIYYQYYHSYESLISDI